MSQEQARARELANRLLEKARSMEAERQRQRREQEEAQREKEEAEMLQAQRERLREQAILEEVSRKLEKEQEQIEDAEKTLGDKLKTAEAIQQKQGQYLVNYMAAPAELDSQMDNFAKEWIDQIAKVKDPEMHEKLLSNTSAFLELMREKFKQDIEEKLKKQASECYVPYASPF